MFKFTNVCVMREKLTFKMLWMYFSLAGVRILVASKGWD